MDDARQGMWCGGDREPADSERKKGMKRQKKDFKRIKNRFSNRYNTLTGQSQIQRTKVIIFSEPIFVRLAPSVHYEWILSHLNPTSACRILTKRFDFAAIRV